MSSSDDESDDEYYNCDDAPVISKDRENDDARPDGLTKDFENRKATVEAVKFYYLKGHDKQMVQDKSRTLGNLFDICMTFLFTIK